MDSSTYLPYDFKLVILEYDFSIEFICISPIVTEQLPERLIYTVQIGFIIKMLRFNFPLQHPPSLTTIPFDRKVNMNSYFVLFLMNLKFDTNIYILMSHKVYIFNFISVFEIISKMSQ